MRMSLQRMVCEKEKGKEEKGKEDYLVSFRSRCWK